MQALRPGLSPEASVGVVKTTRIFIERYGALGLFRGIGAVAAGAGMHVNYTF